MKNEVLEILKEVGAFIPEGHFVGVSGAHLDMYINKDALLPHTEKVSRIGRLFAEKYKDVEIDVVVAPALGGIAFSQWTAFYLTELKGKEILSLYTEKTPEKDQIFTRGNDERVKGKKALVIEDTVTTGSSVMKVVNSVRKAGGEIVSVCVMINRNPDTVNSQNLGVPFHSLSELKTVTYSPDECPLCKSGVPINIKVGHGKKFLESKKSSA